MVKYAIMGATGHIGQVITEELLKKGHHVVAIGRDKTKLQHLKSKGAEVVSCAFDDAKALGRAFKGSNAVFSFIPPPVNTDDFEAAQNTAGRAIEQAINEQKIHYVVNLSSIGAQLSTGTGPIKSLGQQEKRLNAVPSLAVLHLRCAYFMENLFSFIPLIKHEGVIGSILRPDLPMHMIATRDIALKAAAFLHELNFTGQTVFELVGPQEVSMEEVAVIIGQAIGKPTLQYTQFSTEEAEKHFLALGMKPKTAKLFIEMYKAFNEGKITPTQRITPEHRGKITVEEFVKDFQELLHLKRTA